MPVVVEVTVMVVVVSVLLVALHTCHHAERYVLIGDHTRHHFSCVAYARAQTPRAQHAATPIFSLRRASLTLQMWPYTGVGRHGTLQTAGGLLRKDRMGKATPTTPYAGQAPRADLLT